MIEINGYTSFGQTPFGLQTIGLYTQYEETWCLYNKKALQIRNVQTP